MLAKGCLQVILSAMCGDEGARLIVSIASINNRSAEFSREAMLLLAEVSHLALGNSHPAGSPEAAIADTQLA